MKFSTSAAVALGAAGGVVADSSTWSDWDPTTTTSWTADPTTTTSWTWTADPTTTTSWTADPATTSAWSDWDPKKSSTTWTDWDPKTTSTTAWPEWDPKTSVYGWSSSVKPFEHHVCAATSTETVWEVGTVTTTVYATPVGSWSGAIVVTETDTVTVWVGPGGTPVSTEYGDYVTATAYDGAWTADPSVSAVGDYATSTAYGVWPETTDPAAWGPGVVSVIATNGDAGWDWTVPIPTQTNWGPSSPISTDNCGEPITGHDSSSCNTAADRSTWCDGKDINTDYYNDYPTTGNVCSYDFVITNTTLNFDGTDKLALAINGQSPGPLIECNWGDTVKITVTNNLENNGTSIHWHGIRQVGTNNQDGVPGVTECAIAPGTTRTYTWLATSYGTSWYHSHWLTQYGDGIRGPIIIHGPATDNYDIDMGPVIVTDLYVFNDCFGLP
jgi:Multicopper oxidase